jgi:3-hydroxyisobutyrate dehydrogenase
MGPDNDRGRHHSVEAPPRAPGGSSEPAVTVVGTGIMGTAMANRLIDRGFGVAAWSRHPASNRGLVEHGGQVHGDVCDAVSEAQVVITMLPSANATRSVMFDGGAMEHMAAGAIWVQMGTIGVSETERLEVEAHQLRPDVTFVDAPVSGSRVPAETGQLLILASGPPAAAMKLESVFGALGRSTLWLGPAAAGSQMKLVLNTWLAFQTEGAAEAAALASHFGLGREALAAALEGNPLASDYAIAKLRRMIDADYETDFSLGWALKDLDLVAEGAPDAAPVAAAIADRWRTLVDDGWGDADVSAARNGLGSATSTEGVLR